MASTPAAGYVIVGRVRKAHGLRGEVVVEPLTDTPDAIFASGRRVLGGSVTGDAPSDPGADVLTIATVGRQGHGLRVQFDAIADRSAADRWRGRYLFVPAEELSPLESGEVYLHELEGMQVVLAAGDAVGPVAAVYELPQGIALEVARTSGGNVLVPYLGVVTDVDRDRKVITIDPPHGLLD